VISVSLLVFNCSLSCCC